MGLKEWITGSYKGDTYEISVKELLGAETELEIRRLAFWTCINLISNALSLCEFRTFDKGAEVKDAEYYAWNVEPNVNQDSHTFVKKLVTRMLSGNEALVVELASGGIFVADGFVPKKQAAVPTVYTSVQIENLTLTRTFAESEVLHFTQNYLDMRPIIDGFYGSYYRLISAATKAYEWDKGQHWKVHINQLAQRENNFEETFRQIQEDYLKPFFSAGGAVLPEFEGYSYESVGDKQRAAAQSGGATRDIRELIDDVFTMTARAMMIPPVLVVGQVENTSDAVNRWLTNCIDPLARNLQQEINRKRFGFDGWKQGSYMLVDTSNIVHFDLFANASNVSKLIGSGYSFNDIRRAQGQPPINEDWADQHLFTRNFGALSADAGAGQGAGGGE